MSVEVLALRTPTLPPATHTNCYLLDGRTVVEPASPWPEEQERLEQWLADRAPERILLTHHHPDHIGGVRRLRAALALPVLAHAWTAEALPFEVDQTLDDGDDLHGWEVLLTPGHTPGHLCLHRDGEVVCGDMIASDGTIVLDPPEGDLALYLASLERLKALSPRVLHPAHGAPITDAVAKLDEYIDHRNHRTEQIRNALAAGAVDPLGVVEIVYGDTIPRFVYPLAARQAVCHLQWLEARGEVVRERDHWRTT
ncbi:MAG TPA: MBL fold metallo-hydrolase [Myxococcota bacterium]|nr:MBL fold metallo-hydrolase [Myxococcota bacterium]